MSSNVWFWKFLASVLGGIIVFIQWIVIRHLLMEVKRLKDGKFSREELDNLCHNLTTKNRKEFEEGCRAYQEKLFGRKENEGEGMAGK